MGEGAGRKCFLFAQRWHLVTVCRSRDCRQWQQMSLELVGPKFHSQLLILVLTIYFLQYSLPCLYPFLPLASVPISFHFHPSLYIPLLLFPPTRPTICFLFLLTAPPSAPVSHHLSPASALFFQLLPLGQPIVPFSQFSPQSQDLSATSPF